MKVRSVVQFIGVACAALTALVAESFAQPLIDFRLPFSQGPIVSVYGSGNTINQGSDVNKASVNVPQDIRSPAAETAQVRNNYVFLRPPASNADKDAEIERIRNVESGVGATPEVSRAFQMYRNAAKLGNVQANVEVGRLLLELNTRVAAMQAYELFALAAKKGNADALAWQAWLHDSRQIDIASHSTAVDLYKKASENCSAWAAFKMGIAHQKGVLGVTRDEAKAIEWHWKAALSYYSPSVLELSWLLEYGEERRRDQSKALELLRLAARLNNGTALYLLGLKYATGDGVPRDLAAANENYGRAAALGEARAQNNLGAHLVDGLGSSKDVAKGIEWIRKSALQGHAMSMVTFGFFHETGVGLPKNLELAVEWYKRAADSGDARGQKYLGFMLASGLGVAKDVARAIEWYQRAVDNGYADASPALANLYIRMGGDASAVQAAKWLRRGVTLGNAVAMNNLAAFIDDGSIIAHGDESAVSLFERAAAMRNPSAMTSMGIRYIYGRGVRRDVPRGVRLLEDAAVTGNTFAKTMPAAVLATAPEGVTGNVRRAIVLAIEASEFDDFAALLGGQIAVGAPSQLTQAEIEILMPRLQRVARLSIASNSVVAKLILGAASRMSQWKALEIDVVRADLHELSESGNDDATFTLVVLYLEKAHSLIVSPKGIELLRTLAGGSSKFAPAARVLESLVSEALKNSVTSDGFLQGLVREIVSGNGFAATLAASTTVGKEPEAAATVFRALVEKGDPFARAQLCKLVQGYKVFPSGSAEIRYCLSVP